MRKTIRNILFVCAGVTMFAVCNNVDFNGEHSSDGMFEPTNQVSLHYARPGDTVVNYSFGVKPVDILTHAVYLPVQPVGNLSAEAQPSSVEIGKGTTAVAGKRYTLNADTLRFAPNAYRTYAPVTLIHANPSEDKDDSIRLVLNLVGKNKLGTRLTKNNTVKITLNSIFSRPDFREMVEGYWGLGVFTKNKYHKLLAYYGSNKTTIRDIIEGSNVAAQGYLYQHVQEVVAYFTAYPDEL